MTNQFQAMVGKMKIKIPEKSAQQKQSKVFITINETL